MGGFSDASTGFYLREAFQSKNNAKKDILQQELLGTDMLWELKNSSYAGCRIKLINRSCDGLVSFHPVVGTSVIS